MSHMRESPPTRHTRKQLQVVVAEEAEKAQMVSVIKETLIEQEPEVISYEVPATKLRTQSETAKPVRQFRDAIYTPTQIVMYQA